METSANPITTPALYATLKALPNEIFAHIVVLKFERVAICIPNAPHAIDVVAPTKNAKVVYPPYILSTQIHTIKAIIAIKIEHDLYYE